MNCLLYFLYVVVVGLIRVLKWLELGILLVFTPILKRKGKQLAESIGVIYHCPGDPQGFLYENELKSEGCDEIRKKALMKTKGKYDKLIHVKINSNRYFARVANLGILAKGETFMDGTWEVIGDNDFETYTEFATRILENNLLDYYYIPWNRLLEWLELHAFNLQTSKRAFQVGVVHYDLGNELFELMLDPWLQYTCGYWKNASNLNDAQIQKMELLAKKMELKPGMRVLDIGCGWGTLCKYFAEKYKVECVGITIGENGAEYGRRICAGLPVEIRVQDYRDLNEKFDRIVSVGMFEHVGFRNYRDYFEVANRCLKDDGVFVLHTIGRNHPNVPRSEPWYNKYIFPNANLPDPVDLAKATKGLFVIEDWHNFGTDYAKTLKCWRENFIKGWPQIQGKYAQGEFYRMWNYYLSVSRAMFLSRRAQLWQVVLSKDGLKRDYRAPR